MTIGYPITKKRVIMNRKFMNLLNCKPQSTPPIWFMRQAGRYHSHYQGLRKKYSFEDLCKTPELAAEVACGPMIDFDYDVSILFSDILFPLELLGLQLSYKPGPTFENYLTDSSGNLDIKDNDIEEKLGFQTEALKLTRKALPDSKSLVGFVGGPWTILSYGLNMKSEKLVKINNQNGFIEKLLYDTMFPILRKNIEMQIEAGAELVYIFDTNSLQLRRNYFIGTYLEKMKTDLFLEFRNKIAYFSKNKAFYEQDMNKIKSYDLAGVVYPDNEGFIDFLKFDKPFFVQGNFSPESLKKEHPKFIVDFNEFTSQMKQISMNDRKGWLCSLSHGVLPKTPEINVRHFVTEIRNIFS